MSISAPRCVIVNESNRRFFDTAAPRAVLLGPRWVQPF
jgi:hypothetical protein